MLQNFLDDLLLEKFAVQLQLLRNLTNVELLTPLKIDGILLGNVQEFSHSLITTCLMQYL